MKFENISPQKQLCLIISRIYEAGLTTVSGGNLSLKDEDGNLWVTPSGGDKGRYKEDDILKILPDGTVVGNRKPSVETEIHKAILKKRPEFNAVVHAHPPALVAMSFLRELPETRLIPQVYNRVKNPRIAEYACPGTIELKEKVEKEFAEGENTNTAILENHGAFAASVGGLKEAFGLFQDLDFSIQLQAKANIYADGKFNIISEADIQDYNEAEKTAWDGLEYEEAEQSQKEAKSLKLSEAEDKEKLLRKSVCDFMARGYNRHLFTQNLGVISARLDENSFLITESGSDNADLGEDEIVRISGNRIEAGEVPSKSVLLHKKIYEENPEINAIIMAAPVNAMVFAVTDFNYDLKTIPECYIVLREDISKFPFGSVYKNREGLAEYFKEKAPVAIVENDCYICTGDSIYNAFDKLEVLDSSAEAVVNSKLLGGRVQTITEEQAQEIKERFK